jgi:hypothetical protein
VKSLVMSLKGRHLLQAVVAVAVALVLLNSTLSIVLWTQTNHDATVAAQQAIKANVRASAGRSVALCNALYGMAITPEAVKLHPVFVNLYNASGCELVIKKKAE